MHSSWIVVSTFSYFSRRVECIHYSLTMQDTPYVILISAKSAPSMQKGAIRLIACVLLKLPVENLKKILTYYAHF